MIPSEVSPEAVPQVVPPERKSEAEPSKKDDIQVSEPPKETPKPRKVAQQPRYERQAMFEGNPFNALFNW